MNTRAGVENLRTESGDLTTRDDEKAEALNRFFSSICTTEDLRDIPCLGDRYDSPAMVDVDIGVDQVRKKLAKLRTSSAAGPDDIHPRVLRETSDTLSPLLTSIFRRSLDTGTLPPDWKLADVVPIFKKGSNDDPSNYKPANISKFNISTMQDPRVHHQRPTDGTPAV